MEPIDLTACFAEERSGWKGFINWEDCPEKKDKAARVLAQYMFDKVCGSVAKSLGFASDGAYML